MRYGPRMAPRSFITGLAGSQIGPQERVFLREFEPWGMILFKRNIENPDQVADLVRDFREVAGRADAPVLVDQEGGRVQRLGPPHWPAYPPAATYTALHRTDAAAGRSCSRLGARQISPDQARTKAAT